jgi:hypothetical protein
MEVVVPPVLHEAIVTLATKRTMLELDKNSLETIVVGSSHGDCAFNPAYFDLSFNLCSSSQDLKHSFGLYRHTCNEAHNLKRVIVFYSVFSPGFYLEKVHSEKEKCPALNEIFSLGLVYDDPEIEALSANIRGKLGGFAYEPEIGSCSGFTPTQGKYRFPETYGAQRRAQDHMKLNVIHEANVHLLDIMLLAKSRGHDVYIVIPPVREDYMEALNGDFSNLFGDLIDIVTMYRNLSPTQKIDIVSFFGDDDFQHEHFGDYDHLLPTGAGTTLLTTKLRDHIFDA